MISSLISIDTNWTRHAVLSTNTPFNTSILHMPETTGWVSDQTYTLPRSEGLFWLKLLVHSSYYNYTLWIPVGCPHFQTIQADACLSLWLVKLDVSRKSDNFTTKKKSYSYLLFKPRNISGRNKPYYLLLMVVPYCRKNHNTV